MYTIINYIVSFWYIVLLNCVQPVNWKYCYRVDQWLIPDLIYAWELKTGKVHPYQQEKDYLKNIQEIPFEDIK